MRTLQRAESGSKELAKFIRQLAGGKSKLSWTCRASEATDWRIRFDATIKGELGEPDEEIELQTDIKISMRGPIGEVSSFEDSKPVIVRSPRYIYLGASDTQALAMMLDKFPTGDLEARCSSGSTASSEIGLSFYELNFRLPGVYSEVIIGSVTTAKDGRCICCGAVNI